MTEDFITFELAKKLKEKGYTLDTAHHYDDNGGIVVSLVEFDERCAYPCPEIHQVLKWLREEKDIFIELEYINQEAYGCTIIIQKTGGLIANWNWDKFQYANKNPLLGNTYEKAALAGTEFCLDNLI